MLTTKQEASLLSYVVRIAKANPPIANRIQVNLSDHVALLENGDLTVGTRSEVKIPSPITSRLAAALKDPEGTLYSFARQLQAIARSRNCRKLVVLGLDGADVRGVVLDWNGKSDSNARLS